MDKALDLNHEARRVPVFEAYRIPSESYAKYWPQIEQALDRIPHIWASHWTKESLFECGMSGRFQVWGFGSPGLINVIIYTQIVEYPASRILQAFLAFGNSIDQAMPVIEATFEKFASIAACDACEVVGRKGWAKKLPGFKESRTIYRREASSHGVH